MNYLDFLRRLHELLVPRTYLEIGIRNGASLALSRCRSVGVDPAFEVTHEVLAPVSLVRRTSNDFFTQVGPGGPFTGAPVDFAFIDGMHLFEYALADFINAERFTTWSSVVVFDDVCPRSPVEAYRNRQTQYWTGDVFKIEQTLRRYRPDVTCLQVNTEPTGLLLVLTPDADNRILAEQFNQLLTEFVTEDPQDVPQAVLDRSAALDPQALLAADVWPAIATGRERLSPIEGRAAIRASLQQFAGAGAS